MATTAASHANLVYDRIKFDKDKIEDGSLAKIEVESFNLKDFWTQFEAAIQGLSNEVTKIGFMCGQEPYPRSSDLENMMANLLQYYNMMRDLYCVLSEKTGQTLYKMVTSAVVSIMSSLQNFVRSLNDLTEKGANERLSVTGAVWEACKAVQTLPRDNVEASLKVIDSEKSLASDALEELNTPNLINSQEIIAKSLKRARFKGEEYNRFHQMEKRALIAQPPNSDIPASHYHSTDLSRRPGSPSPCHKEDIKIKEEIDSEKSFSDFEQMEKRALIAQPPNSDTPASQCYSTDPSRHPFSPSPCHKEDIKIKEEIDSEESFSDFEPFGPSGVGIDSDENFSDLETSEMIISEDDFSDFEASAFSGDVMVSKNTSVPTMEKSEPMPKHVTDLEASALSGDVTVSKNTSVPIMEKSEPMPKRVTDLEASALSGDVMISKNTSVPTMEKSEPMPKHVKRRRPNKYVCNRVWRPDGTCYRIRTLKKEYQI